EISFEVIGYFDIVIVITNIAIPQKNFNELFRPPGHENIWAELASTWPNNLPTAIKEHHEWNNNTISYKINESLAIITFIEVDLKASTGSFLQLIKMDESRGVIGNHKRVCNEIRDKTLVIKNTDFNTVATSWNLNLKKTEILKFDQELLLQILWPLNIFI
ncbi:4534_t:CDS:2, partial [Funneliformis geosporum]